MCDPNFQLNRELELFLFTFFFVFFSIFDCLSSLCGTLIEMVMRCYYKARAEEKAIKQYLGIMLTAAEGCLSCAFTDRAEGACHRLIGIGGGGGGGDITTRKINSVQSLIEGYKFK